MSIESIYCFFDKLESENDRFLTSNELNKLYLLAEHKNNEIRSKVAELLVDHYVEQSENVLFKLTYDEDELVRIHAVDALCIGRENTTLNRLIYLIEHDEEYLVRGYAVMSFFDVHCNIYDDEKREDIINILTPLLVIEDDEWVKEHYYRVLYLSGQKEKLQDLILCLESQDYAVRKCVYNSFIEILDEENIAEIAETISYYYKIEKSVSVIEEMDKLAKEIKDMHS